MNVVAIAADLVAVTVLVFAIYFPRYRRRDLVLAFIALNVGTLAVARVLSGASISTGLGLGLFGILSIIRLRSNELSHEDVAFYFASLSLGLLGGLTTSPEWHGYTLMAMIVVVMFLASHPALYRAHRQHAITIQGTFTDEALLRDHVQTLVPGTLTSFRVKRINHHTGLTNLDVRYRVDQER